jgi:hypothetical protein
MYSIGIRIDKTERIRSNSRWLHIASGLFLLIQSIDYLRYHHYRVFLLVLPFIVVGLLAFVYGIFRNQYDRAENLNAAMRIIEMIGAAILGAMMITQDRIIDMIFLFVWALLCLFLLFIERHAQKPTRVEFSDDEVKISGAFSDQHLPWRVLKEVVIRSDYITLFKQNERYLQFEVAEDIAREHLDEVQQYCRHRLEARTVSSSA